MSFDIDMQNYGRSNAPAAVEHEVVDTNSYGQEDGSVPVYQELLDKPLQNEAEPVQEKVTNPQAENFRALREEVDRIKADREQERREHQLQLDMLRVNLNRQETPQPEMKSKQMFDGMKDDDIPSVAEIRKEWQERESGYQSRLEELQVAQMHPDYAEVIEKYALPLVKNKPHLMQGIQNSSNKALFAYELGKMAQQINAVQHSAPVMSETAQRIVDNSRKPGTLSQAGGQAVLSQTDYFATMSDKEFMKYASRNLEGI
jgi:hypothetical protein